MKNRLSQLTFWRAVVGLIFVAGLYATFVRFGKGLGASTGLSDDFPWGIWIGFDLLVGVGLAAGGFVIAATVHIFNLEKYEPISRPAILTAFLGYLLVIVALLFDLGRPYRIWHPLVMWNPSSVMFEVAWCVMLYTTVLALEFSPMVLERFNLKVPLKLVRTIYLPVVIAGVLLSTLHQSSLGTLYVLVPDKLYGLWYSPFLPVFFFMSAIAAGLAMTIIESFLSYRAFGKRLEKDILEGIARVIVVFLAIYLVFKVQDLYRRGNLELVLMLNREAVLFWGEMGLGVLLPMVILFQTRLRQRQGLLFFSAFLVVIGFIVNRLNISITGMLHSEHYFPKWTEIAITVSLVTLGFVIFALAVRHFNVFPREELVHAKAEKGERHPVFTGNLVMAMWGLALVGLIAFGLTKTNGDANAEVAAEVAERTVDPMDTELSIPADKIIAQSEDSPGPVNFSHESHVYMQEPVQCTSCHASLFPIIAVTDTTPVSNSAVKRIYHEAESCGKCHNGEDAFEVEENCESCHQGTF
jgi:c(7)-type cytochrome triheme protein